MMMLGHHHLPPQQHLLAQRRASSRHASCSSRASATAAAAARSSSSTSRSSSRRVCSSTRQQQQQQQRHVQHPRTLCRHVCRAAADDAADSDGEEEDEQQQDDADGDALSELQMQPAAAAGGGEYGDSSSSGGSGPAPPDDGSAFLELDPANDSAYEGMAFASSVPLDFDEAGQWVKQVQDWEAFWYDRHDDELMEWEEEAYSGLSAQQRSQAALERAKVLASQVRDLRKRSDVEKMITADDRVTEDYIDTFTTEDQLVAEKEFFRPDPNPDYDAIDLRALAEKRAARGALDAEWRRREALLSRPYSFTLRLDNDVRIAGAAYDWVREDWTEEQIQDLIVGSGQFVHPDKVPVKVLNPLLPMDFHNDVQVHVVPETEEYIESIGHMATEADIAYLQTTQEIQLHAKDFVDPTVVFEASDGAVYAAAPPNAWAEMRKAQDAEDLSLFESLVERVAARQRKLDAARAAAATAAADDSSDAADAAAAAADEATAAEPDDDGSALSAEAYYAAGGGGIDDELMGPGFSAFLHSMHPDDTPTVLYGDDDGGSDEWEGEEEAGDASSQQEQQQQQGHSYDDDSDDSDDSEEGDEEGFAQFLVPPTACPSWAMCPLPGEVPVQPSYPSDGNCAPGFGFVKAKKHSYEDGSYDSYSEPRGTCFPCKSGFYSPGGQAICRACGAGEGWFTPFGSSCLADCMAGASESWHPLID